MNRSHRRLLIAFALTLLLAGCVSPQGIGTTRSLPAAAASHAHAPYPWPESRWWQTYGDVQLDALIDQALAAQPSLQVAQARVRAAQAVADAQGAALQPTLQANAQLDAQHYTRNGLVPPPIGGSFRWSPSLGVSGGWDIDFGGRGRAALEAALGQWKAAQADAQAARVLLQGQIVGGWIQLARLLDAQQLARRAVAVREQTLALVRQRVAAGLDSAVEVHPADGQRAQATLELAATDDAIARTRHALAELAGQRATALDGASPSLASLREHVRPAQLPVDLLGRRADLVAQRWRAEAALRDVDAARAQFLPNVNLVGFANLASLGLTRLIEASSLNAGAGAALHLPLFDGGRLRAQLGARSAEADAAIEAYHATLLRAMREVADELDGLQSLAAQRGAQAQASAAAEAALALAEQRRRAGLATQLAVLQADATVLAQRRAESDLKARRLAADAALQQALGGGYRAEPGS